MRELVKYHTNKYDCRRTCLTCGAAGAKDYCLQCYHIHATGLVFACCLKCQLKHKDELLPESQDWDDSKYNVNFEDLRESEQSGDSEDSD